MEAAVGGSSTLDRVQALLGQTVRIQVSDGRVIEGEFQCLDKDFSFVVGGSLEYHGMTSVFEPAPTDTAFIRSIGLVVIPGAHVKAVVTPSVPI